MMMKIALNIFGFLYVCFCCSLAHTTLSYTSIHYPRIYTHSYLLHAHSIKKKDATCMVHYSTTKTEGQSLKRKQKTSKVVPAIVAMSVKDREDSALFLHRDR